MTRQARLGKWLHGTAGRLCNETDRSLCLGGCTCPSALWDTSPTPRTPAPCPDPTAAVLPTGVLCHLWNHASTPRHCARRRAQVCPPDSHRLLLPSHLFSTSQAALRLAEGGCPELPSPSSPWCTHSWDTLPPPLRQLLSALP